MRHAQETLAERLRVLRARKGWGMVEACERIGISRNTLKALETGERYAYYPTLRKIARGYGVPVEDLMLPPSEEQGEEERQKESAAPPASPEASSKLRVSELKIQSSYKLGTKIREARELVERQAREFDSRGDDELLTHLRTLAVFGAIGATKLAEELAIGFQPQSEFEETAAEFFIRELAAFTKAATSLPEDSVAKDAMDDVLEGFTKYPGRS